MKKHLHKIAWVEPGSIAEELGLEPGLKHHTEAAEPVRVGRGAFLGERSITGRGCGPLRRENAGMSSESKVRILAAEYPRFPE